VELRFGPSFERESNTGPCSIHVRANFYGRDNKIVTAILFAQVFLLFLIITYENNFDTIAPLKVFFAVLLKTVWI